MQAEALTELVRSARRKPIFTDGPDTRRVALDRTTIHRILPHREPFLFVDQICAVDLTQRAVRGRRAIAPDDPVFAGHFPGQPVYPAVLQVETMGQLGLCAVYFCRAGRPTVAADASPVNCRAVRMHHGLFAAEVLPGDELTLLATLLDLDDLTAVYAGQIVKHAVGGAPTICALAVMEVYFVER